MSQVVGDILVELGFVPKKEMFRALRLQKRLATLAMTTVLGVTALNGCAPQVPNQAFAPGQYMPPAQTMQLQRPGQSAQFQNPGFNLQQQSQFQRVNPNSIQSHHLNGPFKTLQLETGHSINIYKNGNKVLPNVPFLKQGTD